MTDKEPPSPSPALRAAVQTRITVADSEVVSSGIVVTKKDIGLTISSAGLTYAVVFEDEAEKHSIRVEKTGEKSVRLHLVNFNNPLGTSVHFLNIGDISGTPLWLSMFVEAVGDDVRVVSYTVYLGGNLG